MVDGISLRKISIHDTKFRISYPPVDQRTFSSIVKLGIIQPVVLLEGMPFTIVAGFRRIGAAKKLGLKEVPAAIVKLSEKEALLFSIHDNLHRGLNIIEKVQAIEKMISLDFSESEIFEIMELLSLSPHKKVIAQFLSLARTEEPFKRFIIEHNLSMKNIEYMLWFEKAERKKIMTALASARFTESHLREILVMLHLAKIKKGRLSGGILKNAGNSQELKAGLKKVVHPGLSSLEKKLYKIRKAMALPPSLDIKVDPFFEKEYIDITIRVKSEKETRDLLRKLEEVLQKEHIGNILELTKGRVR